MCIHYFWLTLYMKSINHCICLVFLCNLPHTSSDYLVGIIDLDFLFSLSPAAHVIELKKKEKKKSTELFLGLFVWAPADRRPISNKLGDGPSLFKY